MTAHRPLAYPAGPPPVPARRSARHPARAGRGPRWSVHLATVAGIGIRVHASFLVLVVLVAMGSTAPGAPGLVPGLVWLVALFACVIAHELAHSVVARRYGIPVLEIELLPIGGVSKLERWPDDPPEALRVAAAGPAASIALGLTFIALCLLAGVSLWPPTIYGGGILARLAWVNLLLAVFNLTPALPLDGGRVLVAVLQPHLGRARATRAAARLGRALGAAMAVIGFFSNVWLLLIGLFVVLGSRAEEAALPPSAGRGDGDGALGGAR
ncbi:MAG TPA: site-2 protease family protein [Acidimicrobiales bacterium]|nr:site-2 protease family protein [Acidimicrobiales bacterium]